VIPRIPLWLRLVAGVLTATENSAQPAWLTDYPVTPGFVSGIGSALVDSTSTGQSRALAAALGDIARQLDVEVQRQDTLSRAESDEGTRSAYVSHSSAQSTERLQGVEIVDIYSDGRRVWVYARLDRTLHQLRRDAERRRVGALLDDPQASLVDLAHLAAKAGPSAEVARHTLRRRLATLRLLHRVSADTSRLTICLDGAAEPGLPIRLRRRNRADEGHLLRTDTSGCVTQPVPRQAAPQWFEARLDVTALTDGHQPDLAVDPLWSGALWRRCLPVQLHLNVTGDEAPARLAAQLTSMLARAGLQADTTSVPSGLQLHVDVHLQRGTRRQPPCFVRLDLGLHLVRRETDQDRPLMRTPLQHRKGVGATCDAAVYDALQHFDSYLGDIAGAMHSAPPTAEGPSSAARTDGRDPS
jgi:hypothetical protein